jgi:hypothetical protein
MANLSAISVFSPRGQVVGMLLYVLADLKGTRGKSFVIRCINMWNLFAFAEEDRKPYPSVLERGRDEPRWNTLVAFARQDCVDRKWMEERSNNQWLISSLGKQVLHKTRERCANGELSVRYGYLWTSKFKKILCPTYEPSESDVLRPVGSIYDDTKASAFVDVYLP